MEKNVKLTKLAACGGCGAKVGAGMLATLLGDIQTHTDSRLLVGFDKSDDGSVYQISEDCAIVQTLDFFPPMVDDPYLFGQIAAANALSDVYAMGGLPKLAQNILCVPKNMPKDAVHDLLRGGYDKAYEAGVIITGGHTIYDDTPKYGLAVTGFVHPKKLLTNCGAQVGDVLFLTKPLGTGIYTTAIKAECLSETEQNRLFAQMTALNKAAYEILTAFEIHACTDVTGFSLMGHGLEMAEGSGVTLEIDASQVPLLPESLSLARDGLLPEGMYRNRQFAQAQADISALSTELADVLFDPQTSGGLLIAVAPHCALPFQLALTAAVPAAKSVGRVVPQGEKALVLL